MNRVVVAVGLLLAVGCGKREEEPRLAGPQQTESPVPPKTKAKEDDATTQPPPKPIEYKAIGEWNVDGEARVRIKKVAVEKPVFVDSIYKIEREGKNLELLMSVEVENLSKNKKFTYLRWHPNTFGMQMGISLFDEHSNKYNCINDVYFAANVKGGLPDQSKVLYPGDAAIVDLLRFERPVAAATVLKLSLPSQGDAKTAHQFLIPASAWKK